MTFPADMVKCSCRPDTTPTRSDSLTNAFYGCTAGVLLVWLILIYRSGQLKCPSFRALRGATLSKDAHSLFLKRRLDRFVKQMESALVALVPGIVVVLYVAVATTPKADPELVVNCLCWLIGLLMCVAVMGLNVIKPYLTLTIVKITYSFFFLLVALPPAFASTSRQFNLTYNLSSITQIFFSQLYPDRRLTFVLNSICLAWHISIIVATPALLAQFSDIVQHMVISYSYLLAISFSTIALLEAEVVALLREREAQTAPRSLLSVMCDALVVLKEDLDLAEPSPALQAMLLRSQAFPKSPMRRGFTAFISSSDVERFEDFIGANSMNGYSASTMHMDLVDSIGSKVPVQIFHTCVHSSDKDGPKHLLGIVEDKDKENFSASLPPSMPLRPQVPLASPRFKEDQAQDAESVTSSRTSATSARGLSQRLACSSVWQRAKVSVDPTPPHNVLKVNLAARALWEMDLSGVIGSPFTTWAEDQEVFCAWLQAGIREAWSSGASVGARFGPVSFCPPALRADPQASIDMILIVEIHVDGQERTSVEVELRRVQVPAARSTGGPISQASTGLDSLWEAAEEVSPARFAHAPPK